MSGITRLHRDALHWSGGSFAFHGEEHGTGASFFWVDNERGEDYGPELHTHTYDELFVVIEGRARVFTDAEEFEVGPGEILVVPAGQPHGFKKIGAGRMRQIDIHLSPKLQSDFL